MNNLYLPFRKFILFTLLTISSVLIFTLNTSAQNEVAGQSVSLQRSIELAKENSPQARAAKYALVSAKWRYRSFRADLLPSLTLSGDAPNYNKSIFSNTLDDGTVTFSSRTQSEASADVSINQSIFPTGGNLSLSSGITRLGIFASENTYLWQSTPLVASYRQPIFQFNALKWRKKTEPLRYTIAQKQFVEDMEDLSFTVTQGFFDLLLAQINVEVSEFNVAVNDSIYNISQGRYQVGAIAENDLLQSELSLRNAETSLTTARLNLQRSEENFKALLGLPIDVPLDVIAPEDAPNVMIDPERAIELALENNSRTKEFELNTILANQSFEQAKRNAGFSATVQASYGLNQTSSDFNELYENPQNRQFFSVGFEIPIFNWGKNLAQIRAAKNQQAETANNIEFQQLQFELSIKSTVREFSQLQQQVALARQADEIAQRRYDVAKNRYLIGKNDVTDLNIAQQEKDSARRGYIQALRNYWSGYYNLRRLTLYDFESNIPITYDTDI